MTGEISSDPESLTVDPVSDIPYLGDYNTTHGLIIKFAYKTIELYDQFLHGERKGPEVQADIEKEIKEYADIFMGRNQEYKLAPWQGRYQIGGRLRAWFSIPGNVDPGEGYFRFLADQCMKAAKALIDGMDEDEAGSKLSGILIDGTERFMGIS